MKIIQYLSMAELPLKLQTLSALTHTVSLPINLIVSRNLEATQYFLNYNLVIRYWKAMTCKRYNMIQTYFILKEKEKGNTDRCYAWLIHLTRYKCTISRCTRHSLHFIYFVFIMFHMYWQIYFIFEILLIHICAYS